MILWLLIVKPFTFLLHRNYNRSLRQCHSNITDEDLDDKVREVTQNNQSEHGHVAYQIDWDYE